MGASRREQLVVDAQVEHRRRQAIAARGRRLWLHQSRTASKVGGMRLLPAAASSAASTSLSEVLAARWSSAHVLAVGPGSGMACDQRIVGAAEDERSGRGRRGSGSWAKAPGLRTSDQMTWR